MERQAVRASRAVRGGVALLLVLALLAQGCGPKRVMPADVRSAGKVNARLKGKEATVHMRDGSTVVVYDVSLGPEETTWRDPWGWQQRSVPTKDIRRIRVKQPARGHVKKVLYGAAAIFSAVTNTPWYGFVFGYLPMLWFILGPPTTMFNDADVYVIEMAPHGEDDGDDRSEAPLEQD